MAAGQGSLSAGDQLSRRIRGGRCQGRRHEPRGLGGWRRIDVDQFRTQIPGGSLITRPTGNGCGATPANCLQNIPEQALSSRNCLSMKILIEQARIVDRNSPHNGTIRDILVEDGRITAIGDPSAGRGLSAKADKTLRHPGLHVSPGWVDVFAHFCDPGYEFKETLQTGAAAAAAGGYTDVFVLPNTRPVIDTKSQVEYIRRAAADLPVHIWPLGAITRSLEGKDLAEMYDMRNSGAIAFSDGTGPVQSAGLLLKGLQYIKAFDGVIIQLPDDRTVGANGLINEGVVSTRLGLPGKPMMAEELMVTRDIELTRY